MGRLNVFHWLRFNWVRLLIVMVVGVILAGLISGVVMFFSMESFFRKSMLASLPMSVLTAFIFASVYTFMHYWFFFGGGMSRLAAKRVKNQHVNVKWDDVVGMKTVQEEVSEVIRLIKDRTQLKHLGGRVVKGLLMVGPPGCGKTYMAKAIATETSVPFLSAVGSEFIGMFVGLGAAKIKGLFKEARKLAKVYGGCLIFIDEIDTIARPRVTPMGMGGGMSYNATVNQLLTELDGLRQKENNIVIIAATNVPEEQLDPALMRAGRFDRKIYIGLPHLEDRKDLFDFYLGKTHADSSINTDILARKTVGMSAADISNMVHEASLIAVRNKRKKVMLADISEAYDRVVFGLKSEIRLSEDEKKWVAYHEAGHAIIAYLTHPTDDVIKASIVPRRSVLGYIGHQAPYEIYIKKKDWYIANIKTCLASYVSENMIFGSTSSGVSSDFQRASMLAHDMVCRWGMGKSGLIGSFVPLNQGPVQQSHISEKTKEKLDEDVQAILVQCINEVEKVLKEEEKLLHVFARALLEKGELEYDEITEIFAKEGKQKTRPVLV